MIIGIIPAKGGSNRLPDKNILKINGMTLIEHAVHYLRRFDIVKDIYVSTDSGHVAEIARNLDVKVIMRGEDLAGEAPLIDVYRHAFQKIDNPDIDYVAGIQPDNPDRNIDLDEAVSYASNNGIDDLFTVDGKGKRNGALRLLSRKILTQAESPPYASAIMADCTNIHEMRDFLMARHHMSGDRHILVGNRKIGPGHPVFIVAEAACNHMCDMTLALEMVDRAAEAGADAIKFQTYKAEKLVTDKATAFWGTDRVSQLEYYRRLDRFGAEQYGEIFRYADEKGIVAFSSPFDPESTEMLAGLGMPVFKIASCDINNLEHLRHVAGFGRPVILSTGASTPDEIGRAVETIFQTGNHRLVLLACTLSYPTRDSDANLRRIQTLREHYPGIPIGISDHTEPDAHMVIPAIALSLGACVVEKHFTLDRSMTGSGHFFAVDPPDLKKMVENIRLAEMVLGDGSLGVAESEKEAWTSARRSIVAERLIKKGEIIRGDMLGFKRPGTGLEADRVREVLGRRAFRDISPDEQIRMDMLED